MDRREKLRKFRESSLKEEAERLRGVSGEETLEQGLEFTQFALEVSRSGEDKGDR